MRLFRLVPVIAMATAPMAVDAATLRLTLYVPVQCSVDLVGSSVEGDRLTMQVHRHCNTGHEIVISSAANASFGGVAMSYNGDSYALAHGEAVVAQPEDYYDQIDTVVLEAASASDTDMADLAASVRLSVVTS